jgi:hypothetical protein
MFPDGEFSSFLLEAYLLNEIGELASNESSLLFKGIYSIVWYVGKNCYLFLRLLEAGILVTLVCLLFIENLTFPISPPDYPSLF